MTWHAVDAISDAYHATRELLFPVKLREWIILGIVVFFVGMTSGFVGNPGFGPTGTPDFNFGEAPTTTIEPGLTVPDAVTIAVVLGIVGLIILLSLIFAIIAAVMEFVFVRQLTELEIRIRGYFGQSARSGLQLFLFWVAIALILFGLAMTLFFFTIITLGIFLIFLILLSPLLLLGAVGIWVVFRFTSDFVVPIMIAEEVNILTAWDHLLDELRVEWKQYGLYAVLRFILDIAAGIATAMAGFVIALALGIPTLLVGAIVFLLLEQLSTLLAIIAAVLIVIAFVLLLVALITVGVAVPIQSYLRYYSLLVLAAISPEYDLLSDVRAGVDHLDDSTPAE